MNFRSFALLVVAVLIVLSALYGIKLMEANRWRQALDNCLATNTDAVTLRACFNKLSDGEN